MGGATPGSQPVASAAVGAVIVAAGRSPRLNGAAKVLADENISCEIIDLRTIVPLDLETILASVAKTGHLLVVDEAFAMCGLGAEINAANTMHNDTAMHLAAYLGYEEIVQVLADHGAGLNFKNMHNM